MTVQELIERLRAMPQDALVVVWPYDGQGPGALTACETVSVLDGNRVLLEDEVFTAFPRQWIQGEAKSGTKS